MIKIIAKDAIEALKWAGMAAAIEARSLRKAGRKVSDEDAARLLLTMLESHGYTVTRQLPQTTK